VSLVTAQTARPTRPISATKPVFSMKVSSGDVGLEPNWYAGRDTGTKGKLRERWGGVVEGGLQALFVDRGGGALRVRCQRAMASASTPSV